MISRGDDYPLHQTARPVHEPATTDRNFYDRFFFNGYSPDGSVFFAAALGVYPNLGVMDAAFGVVHDGMQTNVRASRLLGEDRLDTRVGPVQVEIVEPLRRLRLRVRHRASGVRADLLFTARGPAIEEPPYLITRGARRVAEMTRLTQHASWSGTISVNRGLHTADGWWGCRDRSWGVRPVGERIPGGAPLGEPQYHSLWAPVNFADLLVHADRHDDGDGVPWHSFGVTAAPGAAVATRAQAVDWKIAYRPGTRHAAGAALTLTPVAGRPLAVELTPLYAFQMQGIGYGHPTWGHGMYVGPDEATCDSAQLVDVDETLPLHQHIQAVCTARAGRRRGIGTLEMLIWGRHTPSGFRELLDMAP